MRRLLREWIDQELSRRFAIAAAALTLIMVLLVAAPGYWFSKRMVERGISSELDTNANLTLQRLNLSLESIRESLTNLAENPILSTALVDSSGREIYLVPFMKSYKVSGLGHVRLSLLDFQGTLIVSNGPAPDTANKPWLQGVMNGNSHTEIDARTGEILCALPVIYPATGLPEGVLLSIFNLRPIIESATDRIDPSMSTWLAHSEEDISLGRRHRPLRDNAMSLRRHLKLAHPFSDLDLSLFIARDWNIAYAPVRSLQLGFLAVSLLVLPVAIALSWWAGRRLSAPLVELTERATRIAYGENVEFPSENYHTGEVGRLGQSFVLMLSRLRASHQDLERRVEERTRQLQTAKEEAERANRAKTQFLSSMSHDLRTPLNAVIGFSEILETEPSLGPKNLEMVQKIMGAGRHLLMLINDILDLALIESGGLSVLRQSVDPKTIIDECIKVTQPLATRSGIRIDQSGGAGPTRLNLDPTRLRQVLINLLSNAVKYNREHGSVRVTTDAPSPGVFRISIADTGSGIAPERLRELFQPFNRLGAERSGIEGSGIGLVITKRLVELMDGSVHVESQLGEGSTFTLSFPSSSLPESDTTQRVSTPAKGRPLRPGTKVLYIEDSPVNITLIQKYFERFPELSLILAETAERGLELLRSERPDIVLMDIHLPGMTGYEAAVQIRRDPSNQLLPIIGLSAGAMTDDVDKGMKAGFSDYLTKPFKLKDLITMIAHWTSGDADEGSSNPCSRKSGSG